MTSTTDISGCANTTNNALYTLVTRSIFVPSAQVPHLLWILSESQTTFSEAVGYFLHLVVEPAQTRSNCHDFHHSIHRSVVSIIQRVLTLSTNCSNSVQVHATKENRKQLWTKLAAEAAISTTLAFLVIAATSLLIRPRNIWQWESDDGRLANTRCSNFLVLSRTPQLHNVH